MTNGHGSGLDRVDQSIDVLEEISSGTWREGARGPGQGQGHGPFASMDSPPHSPMDHTESEPIVLKLTDLSIPDYEDDLHGLPVRVPTHSPISSISLN